MTILQSFKRGVWEAHIVRIGRDSTSRLRIRLDYPNGYNTEWPVKYDDERIGYDHYKMSRDAQRATRAAFKALEG